MNESSHSGPTWKERLEQITPESELERLLEREDKLRSNLTGWQERCHAAEERIRDLEEQLEAAREALQGAKDTICRAQMRYEHPLVEHQIICDCVSCEGIRAINSTLDSIPAKRPDA